MHQYKILGQIINIEKNVIEYRKLKQEIEKLVVIKKDKYSRRYKIRGELENVLNNYSKDMSNITFEIVEHFHNKIVKAGDFNMTPQRFYMKYCSKYNSCYDSFDKICSKFEDLALNSMLKKNGSEKIRTYRLENKELWIKAGCPIEGVGFEDEGILLYKKAFITPNRIKEVVDNLEEIGEKVFSITDKKEYKNIYNDKKTCTVLFSGIEKVMRGIFIGYCEYINENEPNKIQIKYDTEKANGIIYNMKSIADNERNQYLLNALKEDPFNFSVYEYILLNCGDSDGEVKRMAEDFIPERNISVVNLIKIKQAFIELKVDNEENAKESKEKFLECIKNNSIEKEIYEEFIDAYNLILEAYDKEYRTVDGFEYQLREEAGKAKEEEEKFARIYDEINIVDEDSILNAKKIIENEFSMKGKEKYIELVNEMLVFFDERYRTVNTVVYKTRELADEVRTDFEYIKKSLDDANKRDFQGLIRLANNINSKCTTNIKELWIEKIMDISKVVKKILEYVNSEKEFEKRIALNISLAEGEILLAEAKALSIELKEIEIVIEEVKNKVLTVFDKKYTTLEAANKEFYKIVKNAHSYKAYLDEEQNQNKSFFKKIGNNLKGVLAKGYEKEYNLLTNNGIKLLPEDKVEELDSVLAVIKDTNAEINAIQTSRYKKYETLEVEDIKVFKRYLKKIEKTFTQEQLNEYIQKPLDKVIESKQIIWDKNRYKIKLTSCGENSNAIAKEIMKIKECGLEEATEVLNNLGTIIAVDVSPERAEDIEFIINELGGSIIKEIYIN